MNSVHFTRWTDQLKNSVHEVYWFNIHGTGYSKKIPWVNQIVDWKQKYPNLKGRTYVKNKFPNTYKVLSLIIENDTTKAFEKALQTIRPDVVHSFVLYISCVPILKVMQKHNNIPWIYSSWGSDLFYYKNKPNYLKDIKLVLPRVNYLITDCKRDIGIANELGFNGEVLGTFPGGGGFKYLKTNKYINSLVDRRTILVKGYQGRSGRAIQVLKALMQISKQLSNFKIIVFGCDDEVVKYADSNKLDEKLNISLLSKLKLLPHVEVMKLMGESLVYIGNSNSDGMPNTLLEAIAMGAFPIQSNPGGATEEVISNGINGFLINDCENVQEIKGLILKVLSNPRLVHEAFGFNQTSIKPKYSREIIKREVLEAYNKISKED